MWDATDQKNKEIPLTDSNSHRQLLARGCIIYVGASCYNSGAWKGMEKGLKRNKNRKHIAFKKFLHWHSLSIKQPKLILICYNVFN